MNTLFVMLVGAETPAEQVVGMLACVGPAK
jgi:hypothetical protein